MVWFWLDRLKCLVIMILYGCRVFGVFLLIFSEVLRMFLLCLWKIVRVWCDGVFFSGLLCLK